MKFFELRTSFFRKMERRVIAVAIFGGWALLELANGDPFWAMIFGAAAGWMIWSFFIAWKEPEDDPDTGPKD